MVIFDSHVPAVACALHALNEPSSKIINTKRWQESKGAVYKPYFFSFLKIVGKHKFMESKYCTTVEEKFSVCAICKITTRCPQILYSYLIFSNSK